MRSARTSKNRPRRALTQAPMKQDKSSAFVPPEVIGAYEALRFTTRKQRHCWTFNGITSGRIYEISDAPKRSSAATKRFRTQMRTKRRLHKGTFADTFDIITEQKFRSPRLGPGASLLPFETDGRDFAYGNDLALSRRAP